MLQVNRRMALLSLTLKRSRKQLFGFFLMFVVVFVAFTSLFYLLYHSNVKQYSTWLDTTLTCLAMTSRHLSTIPDLKNLDIVLSGFTLFLFIFMLVFMLTNMFVSIIVDNFNILRQEQINHVNEIELIQFTVDKIKRFLSNLSSF